MLTYLCTKKLLVQFIFGTERGLVDRFFPPIVLGSSRKLVHETHDDVHYELLIVHILEMNILIRQHESCLTYFKTLFF